QTLLLGFRGLGGSVGGGVSGSVWGTRPRHYQLDGDPAVNADEQSLNDSILRIRRDRGVNPPHFLKLRRIPKITGRINIPVITAHTLGDLFVPFSMQQIYAREVAARNRSDLLVTRATRAISHCEFSPEELVRTFDDLVRWVNEGIKPAGDDLLDTAAVANPFFGCEFTEGVSGTTPEVLRSGACSLAP
ncbi:MAG: hypothetical protein ACR2P1_18720, partial [Pseudomonadales bacterium]